MVVVSVVVSVVVAVVVVVFLVVVVVVVSCVVVCWLAVVAVLCLSRYRVWGILLVLFLYRVCGRAPQTGKPVPSQ